MFMRRLIPCLLIDQRRLVKTVKFRDAAYVGDPINAVKIFNDKQADELIVLDIGVSEPGVAPDIAFIEELASECFMPVCYGGGIRTLDQIKDILRTGVEKVCLNEAAIVNPKLVEQAAASVGSQSVVVGIDVKRNRFLPGHSVVYRNGRLKASISPEQHAGDCARLGAGELFINSVDRDGTGMGYELEIVKKISSIVTVPVIACGGAGKIGDCEELFAQTGAQAAAAGSMFVYHGKHRAVLITYPTGEEADRLRFSKL
jgi:imidazole glycerol-phosphate synthase subunit HisF